MRQHGGGSGLAVGASDSEGLKILSDGAEHFAPLYDFQLEVFDFCKKGMIRRNGWCAYHAYIVYGTILEPSFEMNGVIREGDGYAFLC
jgi:hypothetical protein